VSIGTRLPFLYSGSTIGATPDSIEGAACAGVASDVGRGVWFRLIAGPNSRKQLTTFTISESSFAASLALYARSCDSLICVYPEVDPTDDVFSNSYSYDTAVSFVAEPGQTYSILLKGWFYYGDFGTYNFTVSVSL